MVPPSSEVGMPMGSFVLYKTASRLSWLFSEETKSEHRQTENLLQVHCFQCVVADGVEAHDRALDRRPCVGNWSPSVLDRRTEPCKSRVLSE